VLSQRLDLFDRKYAQHASWPILALPRTQAAIYSIPQERADALAAGCALFFLAADIIDDAQDGDLPEGTHWPEAVNAGQALLFGALGALSSAAPDAPVAREVYEAGRRLAFGQAIDLASTWESAPSEDTVMTAVRGKSGASIALFARMGAHAAGCSAGEVARWGEIGDLLGTAIQLRSDARDIAQDDSSDFRGRKATLPVAYAISRVGDAFLAPARAGDREAAFEALRASGALTFVGFKVDGLVLEAKTAAQSLDLSPEDKSRIDDLIDGATALPIAI
jgi:heptaprenyl diphosphate synthase